MGEYCLKVPLASQVREKKNAHKVKESEIIYIYIYIYIYFWNEKREIKSTSQPHTSSSFKKLINKAGIVLFSFWNNSLKIILKIFNLFFLHIYIYLFLQKLNLIPWENFFFAVVVPPHYKRSWWKRNDRNCFHR